MRVSRFTWSEVATILRPGLTDKRAASSHQYVISLGLVNNDSHRSARRAGDKP